MPITNKILIIGPAWVGDMVMSQALLKRLKTIDSNCTIDVLAPAWSSALLERMPEVRHALTISLGHGQLDLTQRWQLGKQLRNEKYDRAIVLPNSWKSALVPFAARVPLRTGWLGEWRYGLLNDARHLDKQKIPLMVQRFLALADNAVAEIPANDPQYWPALLVTPASISNTLAKFNLAQPTQPVLALCPGAEFGPAKRWPTAHFAAVAKQKLAQGYQVWLFGSAKDQPVAIEIQQATQQACVDFTGRTSLSEAIDLLSLATVVISNDSGLMHIAAALQRPVVVVYGSSSPRFTPPLSDKVKILSLGLDCSPCFQRECPLGHLNCLNNLSPELVLQAINKI
jgi:heptosyltransferase-2